ncbi:Holliday junction resolvase RuvX [Candidatus Curtissbacteria bacterium]|nr:Holliday junction resolvase RuvX [Candidatus Curtissbacteria bacterium]
MFLGIDLGQKTTGLAISSGELASPYKTITHKSLDDALAKVLAEINNLNASAVVVGFVEGKIKPMFVNFAKKLQKQKPDLKIVLWDETLTSRQATETVVKLGIAKRRRAQKQHEVAAALILQSYLDSR